MFCHQCGKELPEGAMFCPSCGASLLTQNESHGTEQPSDTSPVKTSDHKAGGPEQTGAETAAVKAAAAETPAAEAPAAAEPSAEPAAEKAEAVPDLNAEEPPAKTPEEGVGREYAAGAPQKIVLKPVSKNKPRPPAAAPAPPVRPAAAANGGPRSRGPYSGGPNGGGPNGGGPNGGGPNGGGPNGGGPNGRPAMNSRPQQTVRPEGFHDMATFVLLCCVTLGIYGLIWQYRMTTFLNQETSETPMNPTHALLLFMFVPFYGSYWFYKNARKLNHLTGDSPRDSSIPVVTAILQGIGSGIVAMAILQDRMNTYVTGSPNVGPVPQTPQANWSLSWIDLVAHAILLGVTCGIYHYVWIYKTTKLLNADCTEKYMDPTHTLLFAIFFPGYIPYWYYKMARKIDHISAESGDPEQSPTLYTGLAMAGLAFVSCVLLQDRINRIISIGVAGNPACRLHRCKQCRTLYPEAAVGCPNCGTAKTKPFYKQLWFIILLSVAGAVVVFLFFSNVNFTTNLNFGGSNSGSSYSSDYYSYYNDSNDDDDSTDYNYTYSYGDSSLVIR